ncbi:MAG: DUF835 domain-containing protein [Thermoplasmata archaeon]|nr:DUF835 domain-containing protein [Thermoplasmata archaeon]
MLIIEKKPRTGFKKLAEEGRGLCISRFHPDYLRTRHPMNNAEIYWLSEVEGKTTIKPDELEKILNLISRYTRTHKGASVLFDGVEYLLLYNSVQKITELLKKIEKLSISRNFTFMVHLDLDVLGACMELHDVFGPYFTPQQEEELRQTFQAEPDHGVQTGADR